MIDREYETLIQEFLDGTASPAEVDRLNAWLEANEEGRTRKQELEQLFHTLARVPCSDAPSDLRARVLMALEPRTGLGGAGRRARSGAGLGGVFGTRMRLAYVFAAGLAAGAIGLGALSGVLGPLGPGGEPTVTGTMMPTPPPSSHAVRRTLTAGSSRIEAVAWWAGTARLVTLRTRGEAPAEIELTFDPTQLSPGSVHQAGPIAQLEMHPGRILIHGGERGEVTLEFAGADPSAGIRLELRSGGATSGGYLPAPTPDGAR